MFHFRDFIVRIRLRVHTASKVKGTPRKRVSDCFGFYITRPTPPDPKPQALNNLHPPTWNHNWYTSHQRYSGAFKVYDQGSGAGCETLSPAQFQFLALKNTANPNAIIASIFSTAKTARPESLQLLFPGLGDPSIGAVL